MKTGKKALSLLMALCMVLAMLPAISLPALAADQPSMDTTNFRFFANGTPVVVRQNVDIVSAYTDDGDDTLLSGTEDLGNYVLYGGWESGDQTGNTSLTIESGTFLKTVYGGSREGDITGDTNLTIEAGTFSGGAYGGSALAGADVFGAANVTIKTAVFNNCTVFGGGLQANTVGSTNVVIEDGTFAWVYGGGSAGSVTGEAKLTIESGTFEQTIFGGSDTGTVGSTNVVIEDGSFKWIIGGCYNGAVENDTSLEIQGGTFASRICAGGSLAAAVVEGDTNLTISDGTFNTWVYGGGENGPVQGNTNVTVTGGIFNNHLYCGGWGSTATVEGDANFYADGGTFNESIFGGGSQVGNTVLGDTNLDLDSGTFLLVYGGGYDGDINGDASITVNGGVFWSDLYGSDGTIWGGGVTGSVDGTASILVTGIDNATVGDGPTAHQNQLNIHGGGQEGAVGNVSIKATDGPISIIHGGGLLATSSVGNIDITIGGTAEVSHIFGGAYEGGVTGNVNITAQGTADINYIYGGSHNPNWTQVGDPLGVVGGNVHIIVKDSATVNGSIYGGSENGGAISGSVTIDLLSGTLTGTYSPGRALVHGAGNSTSDGIGGNVVGAATINAYPELSIASGAFIFASLEGFGTGATVGAGSKINYYYKVTYNANNGVGTPPAEGYVLSGTDTAAAGSGLSRANYKFAGWNTAANGSGDPYAAGAVLNLTQNETLYAQWTSTGSTPSGGGTATTPGNTTSEIGGSTVTTPSNQKPVTNNDGSVALPGGGTVKTDSGVTVEAPAGTTVASDGGVTIPSGKTATVTLPDGETTVTVPGGTTVSASGTVTVGSGPATIALPNDNKLTVSGGTTISRDTITVGAGGASITVDGETYTYGEGEVLILDEDVPLGFYVQYMFPFNDVAQSAWYYDAVKYVYDNGIMNGIGDNTFDPTSNLNRAMMVQILYNLEDATATGSVSFGDVESGAWYADAVTWAAGNGIVSGYGNGSFGPGDNITREQMAVMLYRYCLFAGLELPAVNEDFNITDASDMSSWAVEAVEAMYKAGILNGKDGGVFDPQGTATRAEVAQMMMNFNSAF